MANGTKSLTRDNLSEQVSFIIKHRVKPDRHDDYETWLHKTIAEAAKYHGHMGAQVARPAAGSHDYEIAVRFATRDDADHWIQSETRKSLIREVEPLIAEPEKLQISSGIDYWFTAVTEGGRPPKRWKQWLTSVAVISVLTMIIPSLLAPLFRVVPVLETFGVRQVVNAMCVVFMVVYVVMPPVTRAIAGWLSR